MAVIELTSDNFSEVILANDLVVVDFWAEWCKPCKTLAEVIKRLEGKYPDVVFGGVDIDKEKELAKDFNIISVPAVMILRQQVVVFAEPGLLSGTTLSELIDKAAALDPVELKSKATE